MFRTTRPAKTGASKSVILKPTKLLKDKATTSSLVSAGAVAKKVKKATPTRAPPATTPSSLPASALSHIINTSAFNASAFPHIFEMILHFASPEALLVLRATNKAIKVAIDQVMPLHVRALKFSRDEPSTNDTLHMPFFPLDSQALAMIPVDGRDPTEWIADRDAQVSAVQRLKREQWERERTATALQVMVSKREYDKLALQHGPALPLPPYRHSSFKAQCSFFSAFLPEDDDDPMVIDTDGIPSPSPSAPSPTETLRKIEEIFNTTFHRYFQYVHQGGPIFPIIIGPICYGNLEETATSPARRPYIVDILSLPRNGQYHTVKIAYLRYAPFIDIDHRFSAAKHVVLVLHLCEQALYGFAPMSSKALIVAVRINPGPLKPALITTETTHRSTLKAVTLIFSSTSNVGRGANMALLRSLLRDAFDLLGEVGSVTIVDAASIPFAWLGVENDFKTSEACVESLVKAILNDHNQSFTRRSHPSTGKVTAQFFTKQNYMDKNNLTEYEYRIRCGD